MEKVLAATRTAPGKTEVLEYPMPDIPVDGALMKMEVAGICGTDVKLYEKPPMTDPVIMGHENIGYIAKAGREFTARKGFKEGDLVFVEHYVGCMKCQWCHAGEYRHCENTDGAPILTAFAMAIRLPSVRRICSAVLHNMSICRGMQ